MKVYRPSCHSGQKKIYHSEMCQYAKRITNGRWVPKVDLDRFEWDLCSVCAGDVSYSNGNGESLAALLEATDADEVGGPV